MKPRLPIASSIAALLIALSSPHAIAAGSECTVPGGPSPSEFFKRQTAELRTAQEAAATTRVGRIKKTPTHADHVHVDKISAGAEVPGLEPDPVTNPPQKADKSAITTVERKARARIDDDGGSSVKTGRGAKLGEFKPKAEPLPDDPTHNPALGNAHDELSKADKQLLDGLMAESGYVPNKKPNYRFPTKANLKKAGIRVGKMLRALFLGNGNTQQVFRVPSTLEVIKIFVGTTSNGLKSIRHKLPNYFRRQIAYGKILEAKGLRVATYWLSKDPEIAALEVSMGILLNSWLKNTA